MGMALMVDWKRGTKGLIAIMIYRGSNNQSLHQTLIFAANLPSAVIKLNVGLLSLAINCNFQTLWPRVIPA